MKPVFLSASLLFGTLFTGASAYAETLDAQIPFAFSAGERTLPAGAYRMTVDNGVALIHGSGSGASAAIVVTRAADVESTASAVFDRTASGSALVKLNFPTGASYTMISPKRPTTTAALKAPGDVLLSTH